MPPGCPLKSRNNDLVISSIPDQFRSKNLSLNKPIKSSVGSFSTETASLRSDSLTATKTTLPPSSIVSSQSTTLVGSYATTSLTYSGLALPNFSLNQSPILGLASITLTSLTKSILEFSISGISINSNLISYSRECRKNCAEHQRKWG